MKNKRNKIFNICLILLYSIVIIFISKIHEFSIDELQSWLIARDLNLIDVIKQMKYEGHSFFWHLIIYSLAHFGISIYFQKAIPIIFCIITAIIIVKKAPFDNFIKVLLIFSPAMLFYSSQFARPYCLIPLLLVCILLIYQKKDKHPYIYAILLGLLANMHLIVFPIVGMLALYFWGEKLFLHFKELSKKEKVNYIMSLIVLIIFILILATVTLFGLFNCKIVSEYEGIFDFIKRFFFSFIFNVVQFFQILLSKYNVSIIGATICCIGLIYIFYSARYDFKNGLLFILQFVFMCFVHILFWFPIPSRVFLIMYEVMFWLWIYKLENKDNDKIPKFKKYNLLEWGLIFFLVSTIPNNLSLIYKDITHNYTFGITMSVLSAAVANKVKKFIYCSSMARYGKQPQLPYKEDMECMPVTPYGVGKYASELVIKQICELNNINYTILVPHNIIGPTQNYIDPFRNVAAIMINRMLLGEQPIIYGDGEQKRTFSFIGDCISCIEKVILQDNLNGEVINIGPDEEFVTVNELAKIIAEKIGFDLKPIYVADRPNEIKLATCSSDKARKLLGYKTKTTLEEGIQLMCEDIKRRGPKAFRYNYNIEINNEHTPETWKNKMF